MNSEKECGRLVGRDGVGEVASFGQRGVNILLAIILVAGTGIFFWGADRGFDFSDEGVYLLDFQHPGASQGGFTFYQYAGAVLFDAVGQSIPALRAVGFLLLAGATAFFWYGLVGFLTDARLTRPESRAELVGSFLLLMVSVFPAFCWPPPTPSYNTFAGVGLLMAAGCFLLAMRCRGALTRLVAVVGFGLTTVFLLVVKGSSAVGLMIFCIGLLMVWPQWGWRRKLGLLGLMGGLTVIAGAVAFLAVPTLRGGWEFLAYSFSSLAQGTGASGLIGRHAGEAVDLCVRTLRSYYLPIVIALVGVAAVRVLRKRGAAWEPLMAPLVVLLSFLVVAGAAVAKDGFFAGISYRNGSMLVYCALFVVAAILALALPRTVGCPEPDRRGILACCGIVLWLAALPFLGAAGTTHRIYANAVLHVAPMFAAILVLAGMIDRGLRRSLAVPLVSALLGLLAAGQFFFGFVVEPYRLPTSKLGQFVPTEIGDPASVLKVDPATAKFVAELRGIFREAGFQSGGDVLGLFDLPGVVFAVGGVSPGRPWYFSNYGDVGENDNLRAIQAAGAERIRNAFIIQSDEDPRVAKYLEHVGIRFSEEFRLVGETWHPFRNYGIRVWAPRQPAQNE